MFATEGPRYVDIEWENNSTLIVSYTTFRKPISLMVDSIYGIKIRYVYRLESSDL